MDGNPLSRLADIELPAPPHWHAAALALGAAGIAAAAAGLLLWRTRRRRRRGAKGGAPAALRRLDQLLGQWQLGFVDDREAGYRLATLLRLSLGMAQLGDRCPAALTDHRARWSDTMALLRRLRYERRPGGALTVEDFMRVRDWIGAALRRPGPPAPP